MGSSKENQKPKALPFGEGAISFSQLDITKGFDDNIRLRSGEWIPTSPLNRTMAHPESMGLPPASASEQEIYQVADKLSRIRESFPAVNDGVYCPVCHIANNEPSLLRAPCPRCGRPLLKFGWD